MTNYNLQQKIGLIQTAKDDIKEAIENKGITPSGNITTYASAIDNIVKANNASVTITPSTSSQTIRPTDDYTGYDEISVNGVTSSIDANIIASNIRNDVEILGVKGNIVELNGQTKTINPTTSQQVIEPDSNYNALTSITINPVTNSIDADIIASNIKNGVNILGVNGSVIELNGETRTVSLTDKNGQTFTPTSNKNGITSITVTPNNQARTVTPTTSPQSINVDSGYSGNGIITVNAVTSSIDSDIVSSNIRNGVEILGVTGNIVELQGQTKTVKGNGTYTPDSGYNAFTSVTVDVETELKRETINGKYQMPISSFTFSLPSNPTDIGDYALYHIYTGCTGLTSVDLSGLTTVSGSNALQYAFQNCTGLISADLSGLTTITGNYALDYIFNGCTNLISIDFSNLQSITGGLVIDSIYALSNSFVNCTSLTSVDLSSLEILRGNYALYNAFQGCTNLASINLSSLISIYGAYALCTAFQGCTSLTSVDLSNLTTASATSALESAFQGCTSLTSVDLSSLTNMKGGSNTLAGIFYGCTSLATLSFPSLTSTSFGNKTNHFNNMLQGVTGCTVHFPSNLQSVIGSWTSVTSGFGGTNTTVLFDLPATT